MHVLCFTAQHHSMTSFYMALLREACIYAYLLYCFWLLSCCMKLCVRKRITIDRTMIVSAVWWALLFALFQVRPLYKTSSLVYCSPVQMFHELIFGWSSVKALLRYTKGLISTVVQCSRLLEFAVCQTWFCCHGLQLTPNMLLLYIHCLLSNCTLQ
jgi:hypothetical protein